MGPISIVCIVVLAIAAITAIIVTIYLNKDFLKERFELLKKKRMRKKENNYDASKEKALFMDTKMIADDYIIEREKANDPVSIEELDRLHEMSEEKPFIIAGTDGDEISDYEAIKAHNVDEKIKQVLNRNDGLVIFD